MLWQGVGGCVRAYVFAMQFIWKMNVPDKIMENFIYPLPQTWHSHFSLVFCCCCFIVAVASVVFLIKIAIAKWGSGMPDSSIHLPVHHNTFNFSAVFFSKCIVYLHDNHRTFIFAWIFDWAKPRFSNILIDCRLARCGLTTLVLLTHFNIYLHGNEMIAWAISMMTA